MGSSAVSRRRFVGGLRLPSDPSVPGPVWMYSLRAVRLDRDGRMGLRARSRPQPSRRARQARQQREQLGYPRL